MKNTKSIIIGLICSILLASTVLAKTYPLEKNMNGSIYSPEREGVKYVQDELGFTYPSFNNFYENPNIETGERDGQERIFTLAQYCEYDAATDLALCPHDEYGGDFLEDYHEVLKDENGQTVSLKEGDKVRFEIYFHNNGEDSYDGGDEGSPDATNVNIGINLEDIVIPASPLHLAPKGYIYADNNQYVIDTANKRTNGVNSSGFVTNSDLLLKDENGDIIRTATDSAWMDRMSEDLVLKPVPGSAALYMESDSVSFDGELTGPTNIVYGTPLGAQIVTATPYYGAEFMSIQFDRLPGCFRYSGFAYFEAVVERVPEEPICAELLVDHQDPLLNGTYSRFNSQANDTDGNNFASDIRYWVEPGYGTLSLNAPTNVPVNPSPFVYERVFQLLPIGPIQVQLFTLREAVSEIAKAGLFGNVAHAAVLEPINVGELFGGIDPDLLLSQLILEELIVPQGTSVYFTAFQPGIHGRVHAQTVDSDVLTCRRDFDILPYRVCEDISVNHHEAIVDDGMLSQFEALALNPAGDTFYGEITYSVDPGYGQFFETKPTGYDDNTSPYIIEFDASQPIAAPTGGWCSDPTDNGTTPGVREFYQLPNGGYVPEIMGEWYWQGIDPEVLGGWAESRTFDFDPSDVMLGEDVMNESVINESLILNDAVMNEAIIINEAVLNESVTNEAIMNEAILNEGVMNEAIMNESIMNDRALFNSVIHAADAEVIDANTIRVLPGETVWFLPEQEGTDVIHVSADCTDVAECSRDFSIGKGPDENACETLTIDSSTLPLELSSTLTTDLTAVGTDLNGNPLPATTQLEWTTDTGATFTSGANTSLNSLIEELQNSVTADTFQNTGEITVVMSDVNDPLYSTACTDKIDVTELLICTDLSVQYNGSDLVDLNPGQSYRLTADATYTGTPASETVTYTTTQGVLVEGGSSPVIEQLITDFLAGIIDSNYLTAGLPPNVLSLLNTTLTVPDGSTVYFIAFTDATGTNALEVQATNRSEAPCIKRYNMAAQNVPCQSIQVVHIPTPYDPEDTNIITVTPGDYGDWAGEFEFIAPNGTFSVPGDNPKTSFTQAEASGGIVYIPSGSATENDEIQINATGPLNGTTCNYLITPNPEEIVCVDLDIVEPSGNWTEDDFTSSDEQRFEIEVTTNPIDLSNNFTYIWEVLDGNADFASGTTSSSTHSNPLVNYLENIDEEDDHRVRICALDETTNDCIPACEDEIEYTGEDEEEPPEIEKLVFDSDGNDWEDVINVGGREDDQNGDFIDDDDEWITYLSVFVPNDVDEARIWDESLNNGIIESDTVGGEFGFLGMLIAVEGRDGDEYIIYQDDPFNRGRFSDEEEILPDEIEDFEGYGDDNDDLEDEYDCSEDNDDRVCIYSHDDTEADFQDGDKIRLGNLDTAENIYVFYQMRNGTYISDEFCETMIEDYGICGEEYENEIHFETPDDSGDYDGDNGYNEDQAYEGDADARVVIICPFILTREGGDIFFHSALDTGVDVSECYEVEGGEGPGLTPTPEKPGETPSTGVSIDELDPDAAIIAPTHDVCKVSNDDSADNPDAYRDVLKNFSSSVCEMQTSVAEQWKELHINNAIEANIEKISRFGTPKTSSSINDAKLELENGIYLTAGNLTIPATGFSVSEGAQTYIIDGRGASTPPVLKIEGNITYDDVTGVNLTDPTTIPSVAFVVIDGNIEVSEGVTEIAGVFLAVDTEGNPDGEIKADGNTSYEILTVHGSLVGDIYDLYLNRRGTGDPLKNESSITVIYDARILENTAPGLTELIDINQLRFAN